MKEKHAAQGKSCFSLLSGFFGPRLTLIMRITPHVKIAAAVSVLMFGVCLALYCFEPPLYPTRKVRVQAHTTNGVPVIADCYSVLTKPELTCIHIPGGMNKWPAWFIVDRKHQMVGTKSPYTRLWLFKTVNGNASAGVNITSPKMGAPWQVDWTTNHVQFSNGFLAVRAFLGSM